MIQSDKFDSSKMDIKKLSNTALTFLIKRLIEIFGILIFLFGVAAGIIKKSIKKRRKKSPQKIEK